MLHLRTRAELRASDAPDDVQAGLDRLRHWAENADWSADIWHDVKSEGAQSVSWSDTSPRWKRLGFQSSNPRTDLRTGIIALDNFAYFFEQYPEDAQRLCLESSSNYPLAVA